MCVYIYIQVIWCNGGDGSVIDDEEEIEREYVAVVGLCSFFGREMMASGVVQKREREMVGAFLRGEERGSRFAGRHLLSVELIYRECTIYT